MNNDTGMLLLALSSVTGIVEPYMLWGSRGSCMGMNPVYSLMVGRASAWGNGFQVCGLSNRRYAEIPPLAHKIL